MRPIITTLLSATELYVREFLVALGMAARSHAALLLLVAIYCACGLAIGTWAGWSPATAVTMYLPAFQSVIPLTIVAILLVRGLIVLTIERPARPLTQFASELRHSLASPRRMAQAIPALVGLHIFGGTFTIVKMSIPMLAPFSWDPQLEQLDRRLHGGVAPWELLQPLLGTPLITHLMNWVYNAWFFVLGFIVVWQAFSEKDQRLRMQFFLSFVLGTLLLGSVGATLLSSAGPCFFGRVTGLADPFTPLLHYLRDVDQTYPVWALRLQDILWNIHIQHSVSIGVGISAMPSVHVAAATLFALVGWRANRWLGVATSAFALLILVGSVHLAWHYAIDGYFGAAGMIVVWCIVGRVLAWCDADRAQMPVTGPA